MADDDEQGMLADSETAHDGDENEASRDSVVIEGLRPPLTLEQRRRRGAMTAFVIAGALLALLWPAISTFGSAIPSLPLFARATPTTDQSVQVVISVTMVSGGITVVAGGWQSSSSGVVCPVAPETTSTLGLPEMQADSIGGDVWALLLSGPTIQANSPVSIVWKATGSGAFHVVADGPDGSQLSPTSGPDLHGGSNWQRPGDEWGTTFTFPRPGCWQLLATRGADLSADLWLIVAG